MKLGETELVQNVNVRLFGGTDMHLGKTDYTNSVRPSSVIS